MTFNFCRYGLSVSDSKTTIKVISKLVENGEIDIDIGSDDYNNEADVSMGGNS
jgi:hypothetical protein